MSQFLGLQVLILHLFSLVSFHFYCDCCRFCTFAFIFLLALGFYFLCYLNVVMKPSNNYLKISLAGICSTLIAIGFGRFIYTPILPNMQDDLNLSSTTMGIISSYNYFGYLVGSIIPIIWKFSNFRNIIIFSSIFSVITICLMGFTTNLRLFIILRFFNVCSALNNTIDRKIDVYGKSIDLFGRRII